MHLKQLFSQHPSEGGEVMNFAAGVLNSRLGGGGKQGTGGGEGEGKEGRPKSLCTPERL